MASTQDEWSFWKFESARHDRATFNCGVPALDAYIQNIAGQHQKRDTNAIFVATPDNDPDKVIGYYGLCAGSVAYEELPADEQHRLSPQYPVPVFNLTRLARDNSYRGKGLGGDLLMDCFVRALVAKDTSAARYLVVDAKDDNAKSFYQHYQFIPFKRKPLKLFISMTAIAAL